MLTHNEYATLVEQAPIMIWRARTDMLCDYFNARWLEFTERTQEQEFGNGWAECVHADDLDRCVAYYVENFAARKIFEMFYRLRRHDGQMRWIFDRGVPFYAESGEFAGYVGSCIDVTDKIEAERALSAAQQREIEQLQRFLPVCAWCKKIRSDDGYWQEVTDYLSSHVATVTHGICAKCEQDLVGCPHGGLDEVCEACRGVQRRRSSPPGRVGQAEGAARTREALTRAGSRAAPRGRASPEWSPRANSRAVEK